MVTPGSVRFFFPLQNVLKPIQKSMKISLKRKKENGELLKLWSRII